MKWHGGKYFSEYLIFKLPEFFHRGPIPIFTLKVLLREGQDSEAWEASRKPLVSDISGTLDIKVISYFSDFKA
jgi:hypothetical protein